MKLHKESEEEARARRQALYRAVEAARLRCQMLAIGLAEILDHAYSGSDVLDVLTLAPEVERAAKTAKEAEDRYNEQKLPVTLRKRES
jgi:uncharacterized protein YggE